MNFSSFIYLILLSATIAVAGCASPGDGISDAAISGDPTAMSKDGLRLNTKGADLLKSGEARLNKGRKQVRDGEAMIQNGSTLVTNSRFEYQEIAGASGDANTPQGVAAEAKKLKAIGSRWEDAIESIRDGNALVEKGNKSIDKARAEIRKGRQLMERGSTLVRNSERMRMGAALLPVPKSPD